MSSSAGESFEQCELDDGLIVKLKALMHKMSLDYCSADFIEDEDGNIYFLEMNICGAWWWVDRLYDGAICKAFTDHLESML